MTREEKSKAIHDYCENRCREIGCDDTCPLHIVGENEYCFTLDGFFPCDIDRNYSIIFGNDEVDRKNDEIEFVKVEREEAEAEQTIKDSGNRREFITGAVRDMAEGKGRCDLLPASAVLRLARHFENGAKKYSDRNWEKGIPMHSFIDSAIRHLMKYLDGWTDEDHLCAAAWNCMCAMWTEEHKPELVDIPTRPEYRRRETY